MQRSIVVLVLCASGALSAQTTAESQYAAFKDSAVRALDTRARRGEVYATLTPAHDSAVKELERRLFGVIGPFQANGYSGPARTTAEDLFSDDADSGGLDALMYKGADPESNVVVTTRSLLAFWLVHVGRDLPHNPIVALGTPDTYTFAINTHAAVYRFATVTVPDAARLGVVSAMMITRAQDIGALTPDELIVSVVRGSRVFIVTAPTAVTIAPPAGCRAIRDSITKVNHADFDSDVPYRTCYANGAPRDPDFQRIVAQVQAIAAALPPR